MDEDKDIDTYIFHNGRKLYSDGHTEILEEQGEVVRSYVRHEAPDDPYDKALEIVTFWIEKLKLELKGFHYYQISLIGEAKESIELNRPVPDTERLSRLLFLKEKVVLIRKQLEKAEDDVISVARQNDKTDIDEETAAKNAQDCQDFITVVKSIKI